LVLTIWYVVKTFLQGHNIAEDFKNTAFTSHFGLVFDENLTSLFLKSSIFNLFSVHTKTKSRSVLILPVWKALKSSIPVSRRISVDGRPNNRNKNVFKSQPLSVNTALKSIAVKLKRNTDLTGKTSRVNRWKPSHLFKDFSAI